MNSIIKKPTHISYAYIFGLLLSAVIAMPLSVALTNSHNALKIERSDNVYLNVKIQSIKQRKDAEFRDLQAMHERLQQELDAKNKAKPSASVTPTHAPATKTVVAHSNGCEQYRALVAQYNWNVNIALAVMRAESGCRPNAFSTTCDRGLMQINCVHSKAVAGNLNALYDPATNIRVAYAVYSGQGWRGWSAYKNGAYLKFL